MMILKRLENKKLGFLFIAAHGISESRPWLQPCNWTERIINISDSKHKFKARLEKDVSEGPKMRIKFQS